MHLYSRGANNFLKTGKTCEAVRAGKTLIKMVQFSNTIETAVANHSEAIEAIDHFKNGAISESQTKRPLLFTAITTLCFIVVVLFAATGCNKLEKPNVEEPAVENPDGDVIFAKVDRPSRFSDVVEVKLVINDNVGGYIELARGDWKDDGFTIVLPKTLNPNKLYSLINKNDINSGIAPTITNTSSTLNISNRNVKVVNADFLAFDKDGNQVTYFFLSEIDEDGNRIPSGISYFTYVDADVNISGYSEREVLDYLCGDITWIGEPIKSVLWKETNVYSVEWKEGWNVWRFTGEANCLEETRKKEWSNIPMSKLIWSSNKW